VERQRLGWYRVGNKMIKQQFNREMQAVIKAVKADGNVEKALKSQRPAWTKLYSRLYLSVGADFAGRVAGKLKSSSPNVVKADDAWMRLVQEYLLKYSGMKIRGIEDTTLSVIRQVLDEGTAAGEGTDKLAARVADAYGIMKPYRAERIARTEVVCASERGSISMARSTGLELTKKWLATRDTRTRGENMDHYGADGQERGLEEPFEVMGELLDHPGDTSLGASGGNVINCRCTTLFNVAR
jgi:hypothetical protein